VERRLRRGPVLVRPPEVEPAAQPEPDFFTRRFNWKAAFLILVLHILAIGAILVQKHQQAKIPLEAPILVNLMAPVAPPAASPPPPEITMTTPPVVVPPPVFTIANPPPSITAVVSSTPPSPTPTPARVIAVTPTPAFTVAAPVAAPATSESADLSAGLIRAEPPRYPFESRRRKEEGVVTLAVTLNPQGEVAEIAIRESSGWDRLDDAALQAVRRWRWRPQMRDGQPVSVRGLVEIPFRLSR